MRKLTVLLAAGMVFGASGIAMAANSVSTDATATIVEAIAISKDADLAFGKMIPSATLDAVTVGTDESRTVLSTGVILVGGGVTAAAYTVSGTANTTYTITLPADNAITLVGPAASVAMPITGFTSLKTGGTSTGALGILSSTTSGASVTQTFKVGAVLHVGVSQAPGNYAGTFNIAVNYN